MITALLALFATPDVHAEIPVVSRRRDARWVEEHLREPRGDLEDVDLEALLAEASPALFGDGALLACEGEAEEPAIVLDDVERSLRAGLYPAAMIRLGDAGRALICSEVLLDASVVARAHRLQGSLAAGAGRADDAGAAFRRARALDPDRAWEPEAGLPGRALFEATSADPLPEGAAPLRLIPDTEDEVRVDGIPTKVIGGAIQLSPGAHLIQIADAPVRGYLVDVNGEGALVVPAALSVSFLRWARRDATHRSDLGAALAATFGEGEPVLVQSGRRVYYTEAGGGLEPLALGGRSGRVLTWTGVAMLAGGAAASGLLYAQGSALRGACEEENLPERVDEVWGDEGLCGQGNETAYDRIKIALPIAGGVAVLGGATLGVGLAMDRRTTHAVSMTWAW